MNRPKLKAGESYTHHIKELNEYIDYIENREIPQTIKVSEHSFLCFGKCPSCGAYLLERESYCSVCGQKLQYRAMGDE